jgi:glycosyltransferase involved in cell wall biosynthesis
MSIAISIIGHNEEAHLRELLPQLKWADEVIYVDCDSDDGSADYAKSMGCNVYQRPNNSNFNVNKSFGFEQASSDWIFYLDPDERIPSSLKEYLISIDKERVLTDSVAAFRLPRRNYYFGKWLKHGGKFPDFQVRFFIRGRARFEQKHVHERLQVDGEIETLSEAFEHYPFESVSHFIKKFDFYSSFQAQKLSESGVSLGFVSALRFFLLKPLSRFFRRYFLKAGFLDGAVGFFVSFFDAASFIAQYLFDAASFIAQYLKVWTSRRGRKVSYED